MAELTEKQKKFVEEYLIDLNATQAAIRAGYKEKTAYSEAHRLLAKQPVAKAISEQIAERTARTKVTQDRVVEELAKIAFVNASDIVDNKGNIKEDAKRVDMACVEGIKCRVIQTESGEIVETEVKLASKLKALELLGKHVGMWSNKLDVKMELPIIFEGEQELED